MKPNKKTARVAGFAYLALIATGIFSELYVRSELIVWDNPATTASNIAGSDWLFRLGFVSDLVCVSFWLLLVLALYQLLKSVNKTQALFMLIFVLVGASIMALNMLNHIAALVVLDSPVYLSAFSTDQINGLMMLFLDLHSTGYSLNGIFFGLWLFPLGYLVYKSGYFPKFMGILLMMGSITTIMAFIMYFIFPDYDGIIGTITGVISALAEFGFCGWLLIKGANVPKEQLTH